MAATSAGTGLLGGAAVATPRPAAGAPALRARGRPPVRDVSLELYRNSVTAGDETLRLFELSKCRCNCWFCPDCCKSKGYNLRAELVPILETFAGLLLLTFTVDPELFPSPQAAFEYLMDNRCLSRTMQDLRRASVLNSNRYFYVVEWQERTEQVHFHVLVDATFVAHDLLTRCWGKNRPPGLGPPRDGRPAIGFAWISKPSFEGGPLHAARYVTKYLTKVPQKGFPGWVLAMGVQRRVRRYGTSRGFWDRVSLPSEPSGRKRQRRELSYAERLSECGTTLNVCEVCEDIDRYTGEVTIGREWLGRLAVGCEVLDRFEDLGDPRRRRRFLVGYLVCDVLEQVSERAGFAVRWVGSVWKPEAAAWSTKP